MGRFWSVLCTLRVILCQHTGAADVSVFVGECCGCDDGKIGGGVEANNYVLDLLEDDFVAPDGTLDDIGCMEPCRAESIPSTAVRIVAVQGNVCSAKGLLTILIPTQALRREQK